MRACDYHLFLIDYETRSGQTGQLEQRVYRAVAPTVAFALTAFRRYHPQQLVIEIKDTGPLDDLVTVQ